MSGLLDNNKSVHKDAEGEVEQSHWRQPPLVRLWTHPTPSHKQEWIAWDQWGQWLSMSKLLAQAHVWYPEMVSWTWKRASYRWWSKWKRKVSRLHKWSWDSVIWPRDRYNCFRSELHHTWTIYAHSENLVVQSCSSSPISRTETHHDDSHRVLYPLDEPSWSLARLSTMVHNLII